MDANREYKIVEQENYGKKSYLLKEVLKDGWTVCVAIDTDIDVIQDKKNFLELCSEIVITEDCNES